MTCRVIVATTPEEVHRKTVDGKITLVGWNHCGDTQRCRLALALAGADWVDNRLDSGEKGSDQFKAMHFTIVAQDLPFCNLPYIMDEGLHVPALMTADRVLKHIGTTFKLFGSCPGKDKEVQEKETRDSLEELLPFETALQGECYRGNNLKSFLQQELGAKLSEWTEMLKGADYLNGSTEASVADMKLYEMLRKISIIENDSKIGSNILASSPTMVAYKERVEAIPALQKYMASDECMSRPLFASHAGFH